MFDETKQIIENLFMLSIKLKDGLNDISQPDIESFFKGLYYEPDTVRKDHNDTCYYKIVHCCRKKENNPRYFESINFYEGTSYTFWAVDYLGIKGPLNCILLNFDATSKAFLIDKDKIQMIICPIF